MKKILFTAFALCQFGLVSAEDILTVAPCTLEQNLDIESDDCGTLSIVLANSDGVNYQGVQFDLYVPEAIEINPDYVYQGDRCPKTKGGYAHTLSVNEITSSVSGYKAYTVYVFSMKATAFTGESGDELMRFDCGTGAAAGIYPVYMKNIKLGVSPTEGNNFAEACSYVKVGNALSANLQLEGIIPSVVNEALAKETGIETLNLNGVTASNGTFTYVDGRNVYGPATEVKSDVVYKRAAGTATYSSLKLPFAADVNCLKFVNVADNAANFTAATSAAANESVIVEGAVDVAASNVALGTAEEGKAVSGQFYLKNDKFYSVNVSAFVPAFRGVWDGAAGSNLRLVIDGVPTGISAAEIDANADNAFDLQGRRAQNTKNGVFVVNGQKQFVK